MEVRTFETKFFWDYGEASTKGSINYNHLKLSPKFLLWSKITHATRPTINAKGELSFIGIYTQLKAYIPN
jgi:iron complex outermembrane receptor protein